VCERERGREREREGERERMCDKSGDVAGTLWLGFSRRTPPGAFAGVLHVIVERIDEFRDNAGVGDRTDPYVSVSLGMELTKLGVS
jgi:hypothetical protein